MADQCIVCLEDLDAVPDARNHDDLRYAGGVAAPFQELSTPHPRIPDNQLPIALIKPCNHVLHDECLREWSQKANSCPICRHSFNLVEVLDKVGGTVLSEYEVEDKKQVAEFDPNAWIQENEEEEEEISTPCVICGQSDQEEVLLLCDGCDAPYHTHCIGLNEVPSGHWFCMECAEDGAYTRAAGRGAPLPPPPAPRTQATVRRNRRHARANQWLGAWNDISNSVHAAVGLDLDFSDDDQSMSTFRQHQTRTADETRQFNQWRQRMRIADSQGARDVFSDVAPIFRDRMPQTPVETPEEVRAWGALERAKEADTISPGTRNRKRKSRSSTASPAAPVELDEVPKEPERKLKRPRTRRVLDAPGSSSSSAAPLFIRQVNARRSPPRPIIDTSGEPSFLSSLLREVETATSDDGSAWSTSAIVPNRASSPTSPAASPSPSTSNYHTPRALSITPPPHISKRPGSPLPLTSRVEPNYPPADYSPSRSPPPEPTHKHIHEQSTSPTTEIRQPRPRRRAEIKLPRSPAISPARASMSIEAKESISKIVKSALAPHWKSAEITKEQYADINRDVSRKLYDVVAEKYSNQEADGRAWQKMAEHEVATAVKGLTATATA